MRFRMGLVIGFAAGYVLGTKAGRERYQQLLESWERVRASQAAHQLEEGVRTALEAAKEEFGPEVTERVSQVAERVRERRGERPHVEVVREPEPPGSDQPG